MLYHIQNGSVPKLAGSAGSRIDIDCVARRADGCEYQAEARWKQNVAVLGSFAPIDENFAGIEVDIADLDVDELVHGYSGAKLRATYGRPVYHW